MFLPQIKISDYTYQLPDERVASYPLPQRDASNLLIYNKGAISHQKFYDLPKILPKISLMVFNNTKVVPARLFFKKDTGAVIEVFCLEPHSPAEYNLAFAATERCSWKAIIGNAKRWKSGEITSISNSSLKAQIIEKENNSYIVEFAWEGGIPFSKVLDDCGKVPIPPYLHRETQEIDKERYQTLYAKYRGSVAAPTAGLHFTDNVLKEIKNEGIECENVCLHVGAGTFLPVKEELVSDHIMHSEPFSITKSALEKLRDRKEGEKIISVGTTSSRTLESLYFLGVQCIEASYQKWQPLSVSQWEPYEKDYNYSTKESLQALIDYLDYHHLDTFHARTQIIIVPGYKWRVVDILITNFHQPGSTLLLLIASFIGDDWKRVYNYALSHNFRFLSYGDSSILLR